MGIIITRVRAMSAGFNLADVDVLLNILVLRIRQRACSRHLNRHGLYISEFLLSVMLRDVFVQDFLALLHGPLELFREEREVHVTLQTVAVREDMDDKLRCGDPEATVGHGSYSNRQAATATS